MKSIVAMRFIRGHLPCALLMAVAICGAVAEETSAPSSLVVPPKIELRNPTTEISVGFGDVAHLSPWRIRRRFPRSSSARSGQLATLRDALLAINETVAKDEEMPECTFKMAEGGSLVSVCDIPLVKKTASGDTVEILVSIDGAAPKRVTADLLAEHLCDFKTVAFVKGAKAEPTGKKPVAEEKAAGAHVAPKTGDTKVVTLPGGATMEMIWCGPGSFMMGSPKTEEGRFEDEPIHPVTLTKGFWLGKYEVTQAQWESVMGENRARFKGAKRPMDSISWDDCQHFVQKVNVAFGGRARMPTEAEWEYACRAGSGAPVAGSGHLADMAWYDSNSGNQTHAVGENQANDWGFFDMHGNVLEWCQDWFSRPEGQAVDPKGPLAGSFKVLRGGCWFFYERDCRSAYRLKREPGIRNCIFGFRLACSGE